MNIEYFPKHKAIEEALLLFPEPERKSRLTIDDRFAEWCAINPSIVRLYLKFAREAKASGRQRYGVKAIQERVRWECDVNLKKNSPFKVNNDYAAPMSRLLVSLDPSLSGMFAFRKRK